MIPSKVQLFKAWRRLARDAAEREATLRFGNKMALAKKGSRRITVDGITYRWTVSPADGHMILVAELAESPGQRMEAILNYHDLLEDPQRGCGQIVGQRSITPDTVRRLIAIAIKRGWRPALRRQPLLMNNVDLLVPPHMRRKSGRNR